MHIKGKDLNAYWIRTRLIRDPMLCQDYRVCILLRRLSTEKPFLYDAILLLLPLQE